MSDPIELRFEVELDAPLDAVWERAITIDGANHELWPLAKMNFPIRIDHRTPPDQVVGQNFRTWTLALCVFPIDRRTMHIEVFEHGRFRECSTSLLQGKFCHERTAVARNDGVTVLTDILTVEPRVRLLDAIMNRATAQTFRRRHRRLRSHLAKAATGAHKA